MRARHDIKYSADTGSYMYLYISTVDFNPMLLYGALASADVDCEDWPYLCIVEAPIYMRCGIARLIVSSTEGLSSFN